ncbi:MAG: DUF3667 domain-containing protein [Acidobacteria bacterium]|nr:DUF3667 domain-containing protein [Acidobacteriota bacterium]
METPSVIPTCANCGHEANQKFCPNCGQSTRSLRVSFASLVGDFLGDYFTLDSKLLRTLKPLVIKPGFLTVAFMEGKRQSYVPPLRLYLFMSILFFFSFKYMASHDTDTVEVETDKPADDVEVDPTEKPDLETVTSPSESEPSSQTNSPAEQTTPSPKNNQAPDATTSEKPTPSNPDSPINPVEMNSEDWQNPEKVEKFVQSVQDESKKAEKKGKKRRKGPNFQADTVPDDFMWGLGKKINEITKKKADKLNSMDGEQASQLFLSELFNAIPKVMFFILPLFALFMKMLYVRRDPLYLDHLIFAFHLHAFLFLKYSILIWIHQFYSATWLTVFTVLAIVFGSPLYLLLCLVRVYRQGAIKTLIKFLILFAFWFGSLVIGLAISAALAFYSV